MQGADVAGVRIGRHRDAVRRDPAQVRGLDPIEWPGRSASTPGGQKTLGKAIQVVETCDRLGVGRRRRAGDVNHSAADQGERGFGRRTETDRTGSEERREQPGCCRPTDHDRGAGFRLHGAVIGSRRTEGRTAR